MADAAVQRVLVVDDTEGNRYVTSRILRGAGFEVLEADTGRGALDAVDAERPDLVVLDINLPDLTGFEVVERMRMSPAGMTTPVLHLSASYTTNADLARGLERGADAYLTHPIDPVVFNATVRSLLRAGAADRRLDEAAREWQATFDALTDAVVLLDAHAVVRRANTAACALLQVDAGGVNGKEFLALLHRSHPGDGAMLVERLLEGQRIDKVLFRLGDRTFLVTAQAVEDDARPACIVCVLKDVSERLAVVREWEVLLADAEDARAEAEAANRSKSEFLAVMSHELRTPLNAIGGYAQLLELGIRGPVNDAQRGDLERIKRSQQYLLSLINDVLNFSKIEAGHLSVELRDVGLSALVAGMRDFVEPQLQERGHTFTCESGGDDVMVRADADKVQQILINLLSNALKFTPAGGSIALTVALARDCARVQVRDTGLGIARDKLHTIFEPFVQVDRRYNREQEGIGLGLAISRELARAMGGELSVSSTEGQGSTFTLELPLVAPVSER